MPSSRKHKIDILNGVDSEYKSYAKALMLFEYPELQALVQQRDSFKEEMGRNPRLLVKPTGSEIVNAQEGNIKQLFGVTE